MISSLIRSPIQINHLKPIDVPPDRKKDSPLTDKERDLLRSKIGQLLWISSQTRPDISYSTCQLATPAWQQD